LLTGEEKESVPLASAGGWDVRAALLMLTHLLALVKGELGSREVDASYLTVHGGLQASWDKLRALECTVSKDRQIWASKANSTEIRRVLTQVKAAWNKAAAAKSLADQLITMGGSGRVCVCFDLQLVGVVCQYSELSQLWLVLPHDILVLYPWRLWRYFLLST